MTSNNINPCLKFAALGLTFLAIGCAAQDTASLPAQTEAEAIAQLESGAEINPETFTTEGKPTKTIETPWGPREVYDPLQDKDVRTAFEYIYKQNSPEFRLVYISNSPRYTVAFNDKDSSFGVNAEILHKAMLEQIKSYENLSCEVLETSLCSTQFVCSTLYPCRYHLHNYKPIKHSCSVGTKSAYNIASFPIGEGSRVQAPNKNSEEQLENLFLTDCKTYLDVLDK